LGVEQLDRGDVAAAAVAERVVDDLDTVRVDHRDGEGVSIRVE